MAIAGIILRVPEEKSGKTTGNISWPVQKCVGDFCCIVLEDFAGGFLGGFIWALLSNKRVPDSSEVVTMIRRQRLAVWYDAPR